MMRSLCTGATGMVAQQLNIDVISNNLANVNTTGFKKSRAEFEDLMYQTEKSSYRRELKIIKGTHVDLAFVVLDGRLGRTSYDGIKYYINKVDSWIDLAPEKTDYSGLPEEQLIAHRDSCTQSWQELRDGKLYSCNYAAYATVAGIAGSQDVEETYDLRSFSDDKKKELVEFRLGYTEKGYTEFCKKCLGFTDKNTDKVKPADQISE